MNIYVEAEKDLAQRLGWFGIVQMGETLIGYPAGADNRKIFRSVIPQYARDESENSLLAHTYSCHAVPSPYNNSCSGDTYVAHYKDHPSPQQAKMYLVVLEAIEKLEEMEDYRY